MTARKWENNVFNRKRHNFCNITHIFTIPAASPAASIPREWMREVGEFWNICRFAAASSLWQSWRWEKSSALKKLDLKQYNTFSLFPLPLPSFNPHRVAIYCSFSSVIANTLCIATTGSHCHDDWEILGRFWETKLEEYRPVNICNNQTKRVRDQRGGGGWQHSNNGFDQCTIASAAANWLWERIWGGKKKIKKRRLQDFLKIKGGVIALMQCIILFDLKIFP